MGPQLLRLGISLLLTCAFVCSAAFGETTPAPVVDKSPKMLSLPIFFVTDREKVDGNNAWQNFGKQMIEPIDALFYGCQQVKMKLTADEAAEVVPLPAWGWSLRNEKEVKEARIAKKEKEEKKEIQKKEEKVDKEAKEEKSLENPDIYGNQIYPADADYSTLVSSLRQAMQKNNRKEFIIFVHGCCIGFEGSMNQAAALEEATKIPVVTYAWGSVKGNYGGSTMTYPRTQERFNTFVRRLLREFPEEKITLAGNSVGNMMIVEYCLETCDHDDTRKFDNIILSRADMDAFAFKTQLKHVVRAGKTVSLYVAKNDPQINLSGVLRWFFNPKDGSERVGNVRATPMFFNIKQPLTVYDVSALRLKHIMPHRAVSELLNNDGHAPSESPFYVYKQETDNIVRVSSRNGKSAERKFAAVAE